MRAEVRLEALGIRNLIADTLTKSKGLHALGWVRGLHPVLTGQVASLDKAWLTPMITTMPSDQNGPPPRVEVITSVQGRRRWPTSEKIRLVEETMQPGM